MEYQKTCIVCGKVFVTDNNDRKCCSEQCGLKTGRIANKNRKKYYHCQNCGELFWKPDGFRKKYCSEECEYDARHKRSRCKDVIPPTVYHRMCAWCGKEFETTIKSKKYCCTDCCYQGNLKLKRQQWAEMYVAQTAVCKECGKSFQTVCGDTHTVFCCKSCSEKYERRIDHATERHKDYMKMAKAKRERQLRSAFIEPVIFDEIWERDNGICQICGLPVLPKGSDNNWDATLDHIVPLSCGGEHSMKNCQLAHRICNSLKCRESSEFHLDWNIKSKENNYWKTKYDQYLLIAPTNPGPVKISV